MSQVKTLFSNILQRRLGRHLLFWLTIYAVFTVAPSAFDDNISKTLTMNIPVLVSTVAAGYSLNYLLIPKYFNRKRIIPFFVLLAASAYAICAFARIITVHVAEPLLIKEPFEQESTLEILVQIDYLITVYFPSIYFVALAMTFIKQQKAQHEIKQRNVLLEKEKAETELNFLKAQLHPHFLFNTLNNLYVLTLKKSDRAPETVVKLSEILDYVLYEGNKEALSVEKEVRLLNNYISLEQLRYGNTLKVSFTKDVDDVSVKISPLLLLSIVENAFKHGLSDILDEPEIRIDLSIKDQQLSFEVYNKKSILSQADDTHYRKGIGVSNTRRQLALTYSDYCFDVREGEHDYLVRLTINLKSTIQISASQSNTKKSAAKVDTKTSSSLPDLQDERMLAKY